MFIVVESKENMTVTQMKDSSTGRYRLDEIRVISSNI